MKLLRPTGTLDIDRLVKENIEDVKEIKVVKLTDSENMSQFLVFVRTAEPPHYHAEHDLTFLLIKGHGELYLNGDRLRLSEGDIGFIPKGSVHFYTNTSIVSVLLATFSPRFSGKDVVRVEL